MSAALLLLAGQIPVWSNYSCGVAVVFEHAAGPRSILDPAFRPVLANFVAGEQQDVAFPLVVSLAMKMSNKFSQGAPQRSFPALAGCIAPFAASIPGQDAELFPPS
jgi:hypothetical protein